VARRLPDPGAGYASMRHILNIGPNLEKLEGADQSCGKRFQFQRSPENSSVIRDLSDSETNISSNLRTSAEIVQSRLDREARRRLLIDGVDSLLRCGDFRLEGNQSCIGTKQA
jgi:hypothetical protein